MLLLQVFKLAVRISDAVVFHFNYGWERLILHCDSQLGARWGGKLAAFLASVMLLECGILRGKLVTLLWLLKGSVPPKMAGQNHKTLQVY